MADRRMFSKEVVDTDLFISMPLTSQALYLHLGLHADDDGFVGSPRKIQRMIGASDDDMRILTAKGFIIPFDSGIVVIRHWKAHNTIKPDRYKETIYTAEKAMLTVSPNKFYELAPVENDSRTLSDNAMEPLCLHSGTETEPQLGKLDELNQLDKINECSGANNSDDSNLDSTISDMVDYEPLRNAIKAYFLKYELQKKPELWRDAISALLERLSGLTPYPESQAIIINEWVQKI